MSAKRPKVRRGFVPMLVGSDLARRRLPRLEIETGVEGPTVWLTSCAHGDEVGGIVVVHEVFRRLTQHPLLRGSLRAFPLMNPVGFDVCSRHITLSEEDLNRSFPGNPEGSLAERIADTIFKVIHASKPALVLDLHNDWTRTIPYTLLDCISQHAPSMESAALKEATRAAAQTGFHVVEEPSPLRRTLSHSLIQLGIPALTIELGESRVVNEENVARGVEAIWRVLIDYGMVTPPDPADAGRETHPLILRYSSRPLCSTTGILRFQCGPEDRVKAGQILARIQDAFGRPVETLRAEADAIVLGVADSSVAYPGAPAVALGLLGANARGGMTRTN